MTTATTIMDNLVLALNEQISHVIPGTDDPLEGAEICRLDPANLDEATRKIWDGIHATSITLKVPWADFQIQVIMVPPRLRR